MSQRNPMNERYTNDKRANVSRKSAASAKPKTKAAGTVTVTGSSKPAKDKKQLQKEARKAEQARQREIDRKYYKPDTERYKKLRRYWILSLAAAVVCVILSWLLRPVEPEWIAMVCLFLAYGFVIFAFYIDFSKIRKERKAYQDRMVALEAEQARQAKAEGRAANKKASGKKKK